MKKDIEEKTERQTAIWVWVVVALLVIVKVFFVPTLSWWIVLFPITITLALWCFVGGILALSMAVIILGALGSVLFGNKV